MATTVARELGFACTAFDFAKLAITLMTLPVSNHWSSKPLCYATSLFTCL